MAGYKITIKSSAAKDLKTISDKKKLIRIIAEVKKLGDEPRPYGYEKLSGRTNLYRVRQGEYRIIYSIDDSQRLIDIVKVGHRRDVYR